MTLRVAATAWKLRHCRSDSDYFGHFYDMVEAAHDEGAEVVVLPELHVLELLSIEPTLQESDVAKYLVQYGEAIEGWIKRIADSSGLIIVGGSHFKHTEDGRIKNVCAIGVPGHEIVINEKNNLTRYEREMWNLRPGEGLARLPKSLGVTVCYDSEFPEAGRVLAESGVMVHCIPAFTETQAGFQRVRWSALARAVENQIFTVHCSLLGSLDREPVPQTYGSSAIIAPSIEPFPENAVLRETPLNEEGIVVADLDFRMLEQARRCGSVTNWHDRHASRWELGADPGFAIEREPDPKANTRGELN